MGNNSLPLDENFHPVLGLVNDANGKIIPLHVASTVTGADGLTYALLDINTTVAKVGSTNIDTNSGNKSAGTQRIVIATDQPALTNAQPGNITQLLSSAYSNTNPFVTETNIQNWIRNAKGYVAYVSFSATITTAIQGLNVFNASGNSKTVIIYRIMNVLTVGRGAAPTFTLSAQTTDVGPGWTNGVALTPANMSLGGSASVLSVYRSAATSGVSIAGTTLWTGDAGTDAQVEMLQQGQIVTLPSGASNGLTIYADTSTSSGGCAIAVFWVEF